jgi:hypothetical protein
MLFSNMSPNDAPNTMPSFLDCYESQNSIDNFLLKRQDNIRYENEELKSDALAHNVASNTQFSQGGINNDTNRAYVNRAKLSKKLITIGFFSGINSPTQENFKSWSDQLGTNDSWIKEAFNFEK